MMHRMPSKPGNRRFFAILSLWLAAVSSGRLGHGATLVVEDRPGSPYRTIQSAVNAAIPLQDDVLVKCGHYRENVAMRDGVPVRGLNPRCAILQGLGGATGPAVTFPSLAQPTELSGFTIRADALQPAVVGAGGPVVVTGNIIENSRSGIRIEAFDAASPVISRDVIRNHGEEGIWMGLYDAASSPVIHSNLIVGSGTGVLVDSPSGSLTLTNNTIVRNPAGGVVAYGPGGADTVIANNVVAWNSGSGGVTFFGASAPRILRNDAWSNLPSNFDVSTGDPSALNFSADPAFVDEVPDFAGFEPRSSSPLIDAALPAWAPATDLRGVPRTSGLGCSGVWADVGARENEGISRFRFDSWFTWDDMRATACSPFGPEYQVLRGDLAVLRATGVYQQNPGEVPAAANWCEVVGFFDDPAVPEAGAPFFYLVTGWNQCETPFGFTSAGELRPGSACWASCPVGAGGP